MTYVKRGPFVDASPIGPYIDAGFFNNLETAVAAASNTTLIAPAPSGDTTGATDQAALQALITASNASGGPGTIILGNGSYYVTGLLSTASPYDHPRILGQGVRATTVSVVGTGSAIALQGGQAHPTGGYVADMTLTSTTGTGVGLEFIGCGAAQGERLHFGTLAEGVRWNNRDTGMFTEYCVVSNSFWDSSVTTPLHYKRTSGNESFHGSGIQGSNVIQQASTATSPMVKIDAGCFPYDAPLTATFFATTTTPLIQNLDTDANRGSSFYGNIGVESTVAGAVIADPASSSVYYAGTVIALGSTGMILGRLRPIDRMYYSSAGYVLRRRPFGQSTPGAPTAAPGVLISGLNGGVGNLISVRITNAAATHYLDYLLYVVQDRLSSGGWVATVANPRSLDTAGYGTPTFTVSGSNLYALNTAWPATGVTILANCIQAGINELFD